MTTHLRRIAAILVMCACAHLSHAAPVSYLQSPLAGGSSFFSGPTGDQTADNFAFAETTKVTSVRWWGTYLTNPPLGADSFTVRFFGPDDANVPQPNPSNEFTDLAITRTNSGLIDEFGDPIYRYEAQLSTRVVLSAGTTAYFSVLNGTVNPWYWQTSTNVGSHWFRQFEDSTWFAANDGNLSFQLLGVTPPPGDYNADFEVNETDYNIWRQSFGSAQPAADGNGDGVVDAADYVVWRKNNGTVLGSGGEAQAAVPEASSVLLVMLAGIVMSCARASSRIFIIRDTCRNETVRRVPLALPVLFLSKACGRNPYPNVPTFTSSASWQLLNCYIRSCVLDSIPTRN